MPLILPPCLQRDGYANYSIDTLTEGKAACKAALQRELGLPVNPNVPMLGFIGRLVRGGAAGQGNRG